MSSDEDSFVTALRDIDGQWSIPFHCTGHLNRMHALGFIGRALGKDGMIVWRLTPEGRLRAFPERGRLRVTVERVRFAINYEGGRDTSCVLHKTFAARNTQRLTWYTPDYAKTLRGAT